MMKTMTRRVEVFQYEKDENGKFNIVPHGEATFLAWGINFEECNDGVGSYTTAIIERDDGAIETPPANFIRFVQLSEGKK